MLYRMLGSTGERVSAIGIGGYHLGEAKDEEDGVRIVHAAIDAGITFMDNSWDYHEGTSETIMGRALAGGRRDKVFLMTKVDGRDKLSATEQLEQSLKRLQTDHLDLWQFHEVIRMNDAERIFAPGGGIDAAMAARQAGKIRFIGFTGHKDPTIHLHMLEVAEKHRFKFDTVQLPLNAMDVHFHSFQTKVLPQLVERRIGVLGMKPMAAGKILASESVSAAECLRYALTLPTSVVITGCDSLNILQQAVHVAESFQPLSEEEVRDIEQRTAAAAAAGKFEEYKTTEVHDSTSQHPDWLGVS